jgi:Phosphopantetheine attachment site
VCLEAMPLTPSGKIDRRMLPAIEGQAFVRRSYEPPVGETETWLARIWADLLNLEQVGRHDNFFELGGHSLLVNLLVSRIKQEMAVDIALADVFKVPELALLAEYIVTAQLAQFDADDLAQVIATLDAP